MTLGCTSSSVRGGASWVCSFVRSFEPETIVQLLIARGTWPPPPTERVEAFSFPKHCPHFMILLQVIFIYLTSSADSWTTMPLRFSINLSALRDLHRFMYTIQTRRFFNCWTGGESERGERWEWNRRRWQKRKAVSLARKEGGDVKSEPPSAVMIGAALARPVRVLPCVHWTTGFGKKEPHSAGFAQMLASAPHSSRLWQRAGERRGATTGKRDRNLISYH